MISPTRQCLHARWAFLALGLLCFVLSPAVRADDKKEKPPKEKKAKVFIWTEARNSHFVVTTDNGEGLSRRVLDQFEQLRQIFASTLPNSHQDTGVPVYVMASKDSNGFADMMPEYPVEKKRTQPNGMFFAGSEKNYVALRMNVSGIAPYQDIYQQYARMILKQSYRNLPPWLEEGYINVFGSMTILPKGARIERPDPEDMSVLFESPLLPLDMVLGADRRSVYYASGDKHTVYFAESRALTHFLLSDPQFTGGHQLEHYLAATEAGGDPVQAARQTFGDLTQLQSELQAYIQQTAPRGSSDLQSGDSAPPSSSAATVRTLTAPEAEARIADCQLARRRLDDAESSLEEALQLQPNMPEAEESLGFTYFEQKEFSDAEAHFANATKLDPQNPLAVYGLGLVSLTQAAGVGVPVSAINAFEKTVALNPDFAPAWANLASIYGDRPETMQKAVVAARHAAELAPGDSSYQYLLAEVLQASGQNDDARKIATELKNSSDDSRIADRAGDLLARNIPPTSVSASKPNPTVLGNAPPPRAPSTPATIPSATPAATPHDHPVQLERKTDPANDAARAPVAKSTTVLGSAPPPLAAPASTPAPTLTASPAISTHVYSMVGTIAETACATAKEVLLTLKAQTLTMHLHAADVSQLTIKPSAGAAAGSGPAKNMSCTALRGRSARISYQLVQGQKWDGEIQSIELREN